MRFEKRATFAFCGRALIRALLAALFCLTSTIAIRAQGSSAEVEYKQAYELLKVGKYGDAVVHAERAAELAKARFPAHQSYAAVLELLGVLYRINGRYQEAETAHKQSITIYEKALGPKHPNVAGSLNSLASVYKEQGRYQEAEAAQKRSIAIFEKALGPEHADVAGSLHNLANIYEDLGRYQEAQSLSLRSLAIREKTLGPEHPDVAASLNSLASLYEKQGHYEEAESLNLRSLAIREKALGSEHPSVGDSLNNLANVYESLGRYGEAEQFYKRSLAIYEKLLGGLHPTVAIRLHNLAFLYEKQGRYQEAESLNRRSLAIREQALGPEHPAVAEALNNLAKILVRQGRFAEAEQFSNRILSIQEKVFGFEHSVVGRALGNLGLLELGREQWEPAMKFFRRAVGIKTAHLLEAAADDRSLDGGLGESRDVFLGISIAAWYLAKAEPGQRIELSQEAFEASQWAQRQTTAAALAKAAARFGMGDTALAERIRKHQDLVVRRQLLDKRMISVISAPLAKRSDSEIAKVRQDIAVAEVRFVDSSAALARDFPVYSEFASPKPLSVPDVQKLLGSEEALVVFLPTPLREETFIWAVTREGVAWESAAIGVKVIGDKLAELRAGLDRQSCRARGLARAEEPKRNCDDIGALPFDLTLANDLYKTLIGPVESVIKGKTHLIIVPSGPLTSLPFEVLVTEPLKSGVAGPAAFQEAQWLVKRHALTVLPAVSSLRALRVFAKASQAAKPFVGFGDPEFEKGPAGPEGAKERQRLASTGPTRGLSEYFRGALADNSILHQLPPLPETAEELVGIAKSLGASNSDLLLGRAASETKVKAMSVEGQLGQYRVAAFATHGLVAGEIKGLAEPGLALTVPDEPTETDDGLLTASEVAGLKLDADWVVLSACNTAAGDKPGAEALSGLAKAFFYAGARALLVSHWPVESRAAEFLTTHTFKEMRDAAAAGKPIGRAEALRRSELALMATPGNAHPAIWAPFMVVGEGGVGR